MKDVEVSIIVPIYNAGKYLSKTIESLTSQSFQSIEIICVNDGSTDNSVSIINGCIKKDNRIKLIDKKNEGVWKARVDGIKNSKGKYITFVDSDDFVETDFIEKLYNNIVKNNSDFVVCGYKRIDYKTGKVLSKEMKYNENKIIETNNNFEEVISINTSLWNKLFKAQLFQNMKDLDNPPRILEDMMFLSLIYMNVKKISFVDNYLYNYIVREGSSMNVLKKEEIKSIQYAMLEVKNQYINNNSTDEQLEILSAMAFLHFGISLMLRASDKNNCNFKEEYKDNLLFLNTEFPQWKKTKYLNIFYSLRHNKINLKVAIVKKIYVLHLFKIFIYIYKFIINKLKIDIKW